MTKPLVQVQEWHSLVLPKGLDSPKVRQRILRAGDTSLGDAFRLRKGKVYARDLVGLVDVGPLQIQVVPKLYADSSMGDDAALLLDLLARTALPMRSAVLPSASKLSRMPISEPVFQHVASEIHRCLLYGVPRRYERVDCLSPTIRGRIDLGRAARRHPGQQHLVPIRHAPLQQDNPLTRVLRALSDRLASLTRIGRTRVALRRCSQVLHAAKASELSESLVDAVQLSRLEQHWGPLVEFARVIAKSATHDIARAGSHRGYGLLFPLDGIFETLLRKTVRRSLLGSALRLRGGKAAGRLLRRVETGAEVRSIKPDLIIDHDPIGGIAIIGDAKWKRLQLGKSHLGVEQSDIYQLLAYMQRTQVEQGVLFFPRATRSGDWVKKYEFDALPAAGRITVVEVGVEGLLTRDPLERSAADAAFRTLLNGLVPP